MMKRFIILFLFAWPVIASPRDWAFYPPRIPTIDPGQVNTFCAANLSCTITGAWSFTAPNTFTAVQTFNSPIIVFGIQSQTLNSATGFILGLASVDQIAWRNNANNANVTLSKNSSDTLSWSGGGGFQAFPILTNGSAPTCSSNGTGTGSACGAFQTNSDDMSGGFTITTGTTPGSSGTVTLTFNNNGGNFKYCLFTASNSGTASWNARVTFITTTAGGGSNNQAVWDNNAVNLTGGGTTYVVQYICGRH